MARNSANAHARSASIDVVGAQAFALGAAWRGVHEFFGGLVENWEPVSPTEDEPEGSLIAHGFTVDAAYDPEKILADISGRDRRLTFQPFYSYMNGAEPVAFTDPQEMTNWSTLYLKGSVESGTARVPEYARAAIATYKTTQGIKTRRGPKRKVIRLDEISTLDVSELPQDQLQALLDLAQRIGTVPVSEPVAVAAAE